MATALFACSILMSGEVRPDPLPSLATIKALDFQAATADTASDPLSFSQLNELLNACESYAKGLSALPNFHEPIPTRGGVGTSVYRKVSPSVVMVLTANFKDDKITEEGLGTGVVVDSSGYVLTNWHVIHGFDSGIVFFKPSSGTAPEKDHAYGIRLIAQSEQADLALLKIEKPPTGLVPVALGDMSRIEVAEDIHIIGHPHGQLWSYSTGVVSQIRDNYDWQYADGSKHLAKVLQMQTAINPGNSGGPVLDDSGNMLGLVAMSEEGQNLNYAVAIDVIREFIKNSLAARSRGASPGESVKGEKFTANLAAVGTVVKTVYPLFVSYTVRDFKGLPLEQIIETRDGGVMSGTQPNAFGGFSEWLFTPRTGRSVVVRSSGISPDQISSGPEQK
jgi:S1-C subfamily serine protease